MITMHSHNPRLSFTARLMSTLQRTRTSNARRSGDNLSHYCVHRDHQLTQSWGRWTYSICLQLIFESILILYAGAGSWTFRKVDQKHLENFGIWCWRRMEISWKDRVRNEEVLLVHRVREGRNISYTIKWR